MRIPGFSITRIRFNGYNLSHCTHPDRKQSKAENKSTPLQYVLQR